ncbi:hypothetical protein [Agaribacter marinus]|uniref:Outer membrane beta-barrel porin/alpha-amylase n=1 Tax=Agaribacter marinus TaxID=1431249 RepID=A0AA37SWD4_9ALTE|nr:hypothetical protein [Agaribacter marinus]GLR70372.1 hypothetical protein GCM10007852_12800 [Agaribacter marinus]
MYKTLKKIIVAVSLVTTFVTISTAAFAFEWNITSLRTTVSKPDTSHTLIFEPPNSTDQKTAFLLTPVNNERLGFFVDVNGIEIGYAVDVFHDEVETKTQNFLFSYRKLKHAKITLNYQILKGLNTEIEDLSIGNTNVGFESQFLENTKSTKIELFGQHNLYTFNDKASVFEHFFLNRPKLSNHFDWSVSIVGGWSFKHLSLESPESILTQPSFLNDAVPTVGNLESNSFNVNVGPFLSVNLPNNFNAFAEYKVGRGHIRNTSAENGLKESGDEKANAIGAGISWTSKDQKTLILLRGWNQKGRHIETSFGDLSIVRFF